MTSTLRLEIIPTMPVWAHRDDLATNPIHTMKYRQLYPELNNPSSDSSRPYRDVIEETARSGDTHVVDRDAFMLRRAANYDARLGQLSQKGFDGLHDVVLRNMGKTCWP
jgi:hypothetical protein